MTKALEEEQPSMWSSHRTWSELIVGTNDVLERDTLGLVLVCGDAQFRVLSWRFLLFCVFRSVPMTRLQGLGAQTIAVLALHTVLSLGVHGDCSKFADTTGNLVDDVGIACALPE